MQINIESLKRKDAAASIDFDFGLGDAELDTECIAAIGAESVKSIRVRGSVTPKAGATPSENMIFISYAIDAEFTARCARCDEEAEKSLRVHGGKYIAGREKEDDDNFYTVDSDIIDLTEFAMEFLTLESPSRYLCDENCEGLCPVCGRNLNTGECGCPKKEANPAFDVLDNFFD